MLEQQQNANLIQVETISQPDLLKARIAGLNEMAFHLRTRMYVDRFAHITKLPIDSKAGERLKVVEQLIPNLHGELHDLTRPSFRALLMEFDEVQEIVGAYKWVRSKLSRSGAAIELSQA